MFEDPSYNVEQNFTRYNAEPKIHEVYILYVLCTPHLACTV